jgi:hypothetical protein
MPPESSSAPPRLKSPAPFLGLFIGAVLAFTTLGVGAVVFFFNPSQYSFYPICQFHALTGLNCPGCGGTRSLYALLHGKLALALKDNALFILLPPCAALRGAWLGMQKLAGRPVSPFFPAQFLWPLLVIIVLFTVLRNIPAFAFLSP